MQWHLHDEECEDIGPSKELYLSNSETGDEPILIFAF